MCHKSNFITNMVFAIAQFPSRTVDNICQTFVTLSTFNDSKTLLVLIELIVLFIKSFS